MLSASFSESDPRTTTPVADLSRTGALVIGGPVFPVGSRIELCFVAFPEDPLPFVHTGRVVRHLTRLDPMGRSLAAMGVEFEVLPDSVADQLDAILERHASADALVLVFGREGGALTVLPTTDPLEAIAVAGVAGPNYDVSEGDVLRWALHVQRAHPFRITAVAYDRLQGTFLSELPEPALMAARIYAICPDAVDQGYMSLAALAQGVRRRELSLWWD
ncbi:MAG: DUF4253 domain-containing protein [Myxococcales bacterium]|nr:DUF4253 domain-containing protein [Myxococcales bacterium]